MMSFKGQFSRGRGGWDGRGARGAGPEEDTGAFRDPELDQALREFRSSVHAWSDAVYQRPRRVEVASRRIAWRKAAVWVFGGVLVIGGAGGGLRGYHLQQEHARIAAAREAEHQRQLQEQWAREAEQELAQVDSDVSREVPVALEPLGQLMSADEGR